MVDFITNRIVEKAKISVEEGQEKYRAYFIKTKLYLAFKEQVDQNLTDKELADVIVTE